MPGLISNIFTADDHSSQSNGTDLGAQGEIGLELSPSIGLEASGSHENLDGSTTEWSNTSEIGANVDVDAVLDGTLGFDSLAVEE